MDPKQLQKRNEIQNRRVNPQTITPQDQSLEQERAEIEQRLNSGLPINGNAPEPNLDIVEAQALKNLEYVKQQKLAKAQAQKVVDKSPLLNRHSIEITETLKSAYVWFLSQGIESPTAATLVIAYAIGEHGLMLKPSAKSE